MFVRRISIKREKLGARNQKVGHPCVIGMADSIPQKKPQKCKMKTAGRWWSI